MIPSPAAIVNSSLGREPFFSQYRRKKVTRPGLQQGLALLLHGLIRRQGLPEALFRRQPLHETPQQLRPGVRQSVHRVAQAIDQALTIEGPARGVPQSPLHIIFFIELPVNVSVFAILTR